jgi:polyhydroxybutyrate depolymerase
MSHSKIALCALSVGLLVGCAASEPDGSPGSAGSGPGGTGGSAAGTAGTGGSGTAGTGPTGRGGDSGGGAAGNGGAGTTGAGGQSGGAGGASGVTGSAGGGAAGNTGGAAGSTAGRGGAAAGQGGGGARGGSSGSGGSGGSGGSTGTGGAGSGGAAAPMPSAGCGKSGRPANGRVEVANQSLHLFPTSYDGTKPFPLLIALHACGNPNSQFVSMTAGSFETNYVRTFPNTPDSGQCWSNYTADIARILTQYDDLMANYCIDQNRIFATGHSSGAQLLVNILAHRTDAQHLNLSGVAPVAADPFNVALPIPVMYIAGIGDTERSATSASNTIARFRTANMCTEASTAYSQVAGCQSSGVSVNPGCISYSGCTVPTIWCSHNDPQYSNTHHGVPCFAIKAMYDFFATLP